MKKINERNEAIKLRKQGLSLNEISRMLKISKSTASIWLRSVQISGSAQKRLLGRTKSASLEGLSKYTKFVKDEKIKREIEDQNIGLSELGILSKRDIYCIGLGLYWGEGYKKGNQEFGFTNSDPAMIIFYIKWLGEIFNLKNEDLIFRVSINEAHSHRVDEVVSYWVKLTGSRKSQFTKTSLIKAASKKKYDNSGLHMGTLRIKVRNGTRMRRRVVGAISGIVV